MPRLEPLPRTQLEQFEPVLAMVEQTMGFVPNSLLTLAHRPEILQAALGLFQAIQGPGRVSSELKSMVAHVASQSAGCRYCQAHTAHTGERLGVDPAKLDDLWNFEDSPVFSVAEQAALRIARDAAMVPNAVTDGQFDELKEHFDSEQVVEIVATIAMFGFLNRWNDTLATELEASPLRFGEERLRTHGWSADKHAP